MSHHGRLAADRHQRSIEVEKRLIKHCQNLESRVKPLEDLSFQPQEVTRNLTVLKTFVKQTGVGSVHTLQEAKKQSDESVAVQTEVPEKEAPVAQTPITWNAEAGPKSLTSPSAEDDYIRIRNMAGVYKHKPSKNARRRKLQQEAQMRNRIQRIESKREQKGQSKDVGGISNKNKIVGARSPLRLAKKLDAIHAKHAKGPKSHAKRHGNMHYAMATTSSLEHVAQANHPHAHLHSHSHAHPHSRSRAHPHAQPHGIHKARKAPRVRKKLAKHAGADHEDVHWARGLRKRHVGGPKGKRSRLPHPVFDKALASLHPKLTSKASRVRSQNEIKDMLQQKFLSHKDASFFLRNLDLCFSPEKQAKARHNVRRGMSKHHSSHGPGGDGDRPETANTAYIKGCNKAHLVPIPLSFSGETLRMATVPLRYIPALAEGLKVCTIPNISFRCNDMTDKMARGIIPFFNNEHVRDVDFGRNHIGMSGMKFLVKKLPQMQNLMKLGLEGNDLSSAAVMGLCKCLTPGLAEQLPNLVHLDLSRNKICTIGAKALADMLWSNTRLLTLWIQWNDITCNGILYFADALIHNTALHDLDLSWNSTGSLAEPYEVLAEALRVNETLRILKLENIPIRYDGVVALCGGLAQNKHLLSLHLKEGLATVGSDGNVVPQDPEEPMLLTDHHAFNRIVRIPGLRNSPCWEVVTDCWVKNMWRRISFAWTESSIGAESPAHLTDVPHKVELMCSFDHWTPKPMGSRSESFIRGSSVTLMVPTKAFQYAYRIDGTEVMAAGDQPMQQSLLVYGEVPERLGRCAAKLAPEPKPRISACMATYLSAETRSAAEEAASAIPLYKLSDDEASFRYQSKVRALNQRKRRSALNQPLPPISAAPTKVKTKRPPARARRGSLCQTVPEVVNYLAEQQQALKSWEWWHMLLREHEDEDDHHPEREHVGGWPLFANLGQFAKRYKGVWEKVKWQRKDVPATVSVLGERKAHASDFPNKEQRKEVTAIFKREMIFLNDLFSDLVAFEWYDSHPFCAHGQVVTRFFSKAQLWNPDALIVLRHLTEGGQVANGKRGHKRRRVISQHLFIEIFAHLLVRKAGEEDASTPLESTFQRAMRSVKSMAKPSTFARSKRFRCVRFHELFEAQGKALHKAFLNWSSGKAFLQMNEFIALLKHYKVFDVGPDIDGHDMARRDAQARLAFASARASNNYCLMFIEFLEALGRYAFLRQPFLHPQQDKAHEDHTILVDLKVVVDLLCQRFKHSHCPNNQH